MRRNEWRPIHRGVYVDHTGVPTCEQQRMAAVLFAWPAALGGSRHWWRTVPERIRGRRQSRSMLGVVVAPEGVAIVRLRDFADRVLWNRTPLDCAWKMQVSRLRSRQWRGPRGARRGGRPGRALPAAVHHTGTSADALEGMARLPGRCFTAAVLNDVESGAHSLLEHRYLTRVERAHGLPRHDARPRSATSTVTGFATCTTSSRECWSSSTVVSVTSSQTTSGPTSNETSGPRLTGR